MISIRSGAPSKRSGGILDKVKAVQAALKEIDAANGMVADEKFDELSRGIKDWWERLRPGEPSFFEAVKRRGTKTRRTIDLKVGLSAHTDRTDPKMRDAIAVFSQSQLHCLGLSLFLARVVEEGAGFVVLDDPVLSSDDDFRPNFEASVIEALLAAGIQVIVIFRTTRAGRIRPPMGFRGARQLQLVRNDPVIGTEVRSENDQWRRCWRKCNHSSTLKIQNSESRAQRSFDKRSNGFAKN